MSAGLPILADSRKARNMAEDNSSDAAENRWTVRGVSQGYRKAAADAAERTGIPVGTWLCHAIDRAIQAKREPIDIRPPKAEPRKPRDRPDPDKLLAMTERAIAAAAQLAEAEKVPPELRQQFEALLSRSLPSVKRKQAILPAPDPPVTP
jgi:hypothetical protein